MPKAQRRTGSTATTQKQSTAKRAQRRNNQGHKPTSTPVSTNNEKLKFKKELEEKRKAKEFEDSRPLPIDPSYIPNGYDETPLYTIPMIQSLGADTKEFGVSSGDSSQEYLDSFLDELEAGEMDVDLDQLICFMLTRRFNLVVSAKGMDLEAVKEYKENHPIVDGTVLSPADIHGEGTDSGDNEEAPSVDDGSLIAQAMGEDGSLPIGTLVVIKTLRRSKYNGAVGQIYKRNKTTYGVNLDYSSQSRLGVSKTRVPFSMCEAI